MNKEFQMLRKKQRFSCGRIVKRAYVLIKENQKLSNEVVKSLTGKDMPKGYKMKGHTHINRHNDVWVVKKVHK